MYMLIRVLLYRQCFLRDRLSDIVVRVLGHNRRVPGFDSRGY